MKSGILYMNVKPEKVGELRKVWDRFSTELHDVKGFQSGYLFTHPETGKCFSIGFYDSIESAKALTSTDVYRNFLSSIKELVTNEPVREVFDVSGDLDRIGAEKKAA